MSEEEKTPNYQSNNDFIPRPIRSIIPKGRYVLPRGGGLSNEPVSYSNPVTNFIKGRGSLSGKGLLATGIGLAKGLCPRSWWGIGWYESVQDETL